MAVSAPWANDIYVIGTHKIKSFINRSVLNLKALGLILLMKCNHRFDVRQKDWLLKAF